MDDTSCDHEDRKFIIWMDYRGIYFFSAKYHHIKRFSNTWERAPTGYTWRYFKVISKNDSILLSKFWCWFWDSSFYFSSGAWISSMIMHGFPDWQGQTTFICRSPLYHSRCWSGPTSKRWFWVVTAFIFISYYNNLN